MSFGLSIYTASVLEKRVTTRDDELKIYRSRSEIIPSFPFRIGPYDAAFTQRFNQICTSPLRRMNQPGGFTSAKNCPMIGRTYEWRISTAIERNLLCKSFQAYASSTVGDEVAVWGRCDYQAAIDNCIFKSGNTDNVGATSSAECENQESIAATASLVNSNAAQLAASGQLQEVNEYFQANGDTNLIAATQNNAATITDPTTQCSLLGRPSRYIRQQHNGQQLLGLTPPSGIFLDQYARVKINARFFSHRPPANIPTRTKKTNDASHRRRTMAHHRLLL